MVLTLWQRLPIVVRAVIGGVIVAAAGIVPWGGIAAVPGFAGWNTRLFVSVPWAILPTTLYLWLYWRYLDGAGWPRATSSLRRTSLRANRLSGDVWAMALFAGFLGLAALLPLVGIMGRLVPLPPEAQIIAPPAQMPFVTVLLLLVMASVVAGVVEEAAFRGYMQGPIERRHGPIVAILLTGIVFGLGHYSHHPDAVLAMLPFYVGVSAVYGGLAYATNSILPGMVLHAAGDVFSLTRLWTTGQPEWQMAVSSPGLIWDTGPDLAFVSSVMVFTLFGAGAVWAYVALVRATHLMPAPRT